MQTYFAICPTMSVLGGSNSTIKVKFNLKHVEGLSESSLTMLRNINSYIIHTQQTVFKTT